MEYVLGIDAGTTGTKSALFTAQGELIDLEYRSYPLTYPQEGWVEQRPQDWWAALKETVRTVVRRSRAGSSVRAMSLSTQGGCLVLLDGKFEPVRPAVSWLDRRAAETSDVLAREIASRELYRSCGWPVLDSLCFPTICWFRGKMPEPLASTRYFASTIDYLNYRLTGRFVIDHTNCALTGFLDLDSRGLSEKTMRIARIDAAELPEIAASGQAIGGLDAEAARELGLSGDVLVVSGAHDRYCESVGAGAVRPGDCVLGAGTSWVLLTTSDRILFHKPVSDDRGFMRTVFPGLHPVAGRFGLMTVVPHGGNSLQWFRDVLRPDTSFEQLNTDASEIEPGSGGLLFIPVSCSKNGKGSFQGLDAAHTIEHFTRAVFEGVVFANRMNLDLFREAGLPIGRLTMIGGGTKSGVWPQMVADICDVPVEVPRQQEAACTGAAVLAAAGCGVVSSVEQGSLLFKGECARVRPSSIGAARYEERLSAFRRSLR